MKKSIFTLNVDNYSPEITAITYPFIKQYAEKIDADFIQITKRKFEHMPVTFEKLQIFNYKDMYDWIIYIDSDALIHPNMFDVTEMLPQDTVMTYDADFAIGRFKYNNYFRRDGRHIGVGNWFTVAPNWCIDLWNYEESLERLDYSSLIYPTKYEQEVGIEPEHLVDDYVLSRNIAKYGLKHTTFLEFFKDRINPLTFLHHNYLSKNKVEELKQVISSW